MNQEWEGHPGALVWSELGAVLGYPAARTCTPTNPALKQKGWSLSKGDDGRSSLVAPGGGCLKIEGRGYPGGAGGLVVVSCNSSDPAQVSRSYRVLLSAADAADCCRRYQRYRRYRRYPVTIHHAASRSPFTHFCLAP